VARAVFGPFGLTFVAVAVMVSTLGTSNGTILASSRVYYAMAVDGMFFRSLATVHPTHHTPTRSLWWQLGWTSVLIFSGTFDMLTDMLIFVSWVFYGLGAYGVFVLRRRMPEAHRPYRTWGYPVVPIVFIAFAVVFLVFTIVSDVKNYADGTSPVINSLWGMILLAAGIPFYVMFRRRAQDDAPRTSRQG
jgi:basic amino acid/polyamine antiporter, APA family